MVVDLFTIGLLVVLEGLLSADNALVMAAMVVKLPSELHSRALSYGLAGAFVLRIAATLLATYLIQVAWIKLAGGLYLLYLVYHHFVVNAPHETTPGGAPNASAFWKFLIQLEFVNLAFSVDSILVAVAMSPKRLVVLAGGLLGLLMMRLVVSQLISLMKRWPALADGAFIVIAWVALRMILGYAFDRGWIGWQIPQDWAIAIIFVLLGLSGLYAIRQGPNTD